MSEKELNIKDLTFVCKGQNSDRYSQQPLFTDVNGESVCIGDIVEFRINQVFPSSGEIILKDNGIYVKTFNQVFYDWEYYKLNS